MNINSKICTLINRDPEWEKTLEELGIRVKKELPLAIFNYGISADFTNELVREARGIIINLETLDVVCWPFTKFCNVHEEGAKIDLENFDWGHSHCQEKIDGSIVKLFFNPITDQWQWATNACINAADAGVGSLIGTTFDEIIHEADNYGDIKFDDLNKNFTYIFEVVSPKTQVVVKYPKEHLYHIGTRSNRTGKEYRANIGIERPMEYPLFTLGDCIDAAKKLNMDSDEVTKEGFVVVDRNWNRIKVKSPEYLELHHMFNNGNLGKSRIIEMIRSGDCSIDEIVNQYPTYAVYIKYYSFKMEELEWNIERFISYVRALYKEYNQEKKAVACEIKNHKYAGFGFSAIGNEKSAKELLLSISSSKYLKMIPDYEPEKLF